MRGRSDADKTEQLLGFLEGEAFDDYFERFAEKGALSDAALDYATAKKVLVDHFAEVVEHDEQLREAVDSQLNPEDLLGSLRQMELLFGKAGFNEDGNSGLLALRS